MRVSKWIVLVSLAVGLVGIGVFGTVPRASADAGPHGSYDPDTAACAGCHRAHTAAGPLLLTEADVTELCYSCHGNGTDTLNVRMGSTVGGQRLAGGGFETAWKGTPLGGTATWVATSTGVATHGLGEEATAWGGASDGAGVLGTLECTSCHNPHGSNNFRILKDSHNGFPHADYQCGGTPGCAAKAHRWMESDETLDWVSYQVVPVPPEEEDNYSPGDNAYYSGLLEIAGGGDIVTTLGMSAFCASCHKQYLTKSGSYAYPSTDADHYVYPGTQDAQDGNSDVERYRHAILHDHGSPETPLRRAAVGTVDGGEGGGPRTTCVNGTDDDSDGDVDLDDSECSQDFGTDPEYGAMTCLTCHFAHGSAAAAAGAAANVPPTNDNALLYYDNRGVCRSCHQDDK